MGDKNVGLHARLMSQAMRKLTGSIARTRTCCIFINQIREKIGLMFGNPETTTGGNALKFYSSVRLEIRPSSFIKDGDTTIGRLAKVKVVKNKVAPPFMKTEFELMFGEGISKAGEIIDMAVDLGIVKKSGAWFSYNGTKLGQGRDAVKRVIKENAELSAELEKKIKDALEAKREASRKKTVNPFLPGKDAVRTDKEEETEQTADVDDFGSDSASDSDDLFADDFDVEIEE